MEVSAGEVVALEGPSGSGKTTLFRDLAKSEQRGLVVVTHDPMVRLGTTVDLRIAPAAP
jgi:ABC-type lipoprotein export system ATPase subunit